MIIKYSYKNTNIETYDREKLLIQYLQNLLNCLNYSNLATLCLKYCTNKE